MSNDKQFLLIDQKFLLNRDHVDRVGFMHSAKELSASEKQSLPKGIHDLSSGVVTAETWHAFQAAKTIIGSGGVELTLEGQFFAAEVDNNAHLKGVQAASKQRDSIFFGWTRD